MSLPERGRDHDEILEHLEANSSRPDQEAKPGKAAGPGIDEPTWALTYPQAIAASEKMSDDAAYAVAKAMYENQPALAKLLPPFRLFKPAEMVGPSGGVPYHPGAIKFYKEVGIWKE